MTQAAILAICPYSYQGESYISLSLVDPGNDRDLIIEEIEEYGGSSEFLTLDDEKIIFRLV